MTAIEGLFATSLQRFRDCDWVGWAALFAEEAMLHAPNGAAVRGRAAIQAWGEAFPKVEAINLANIEISGEGNLAYATCDYTLTVENLAPDAGKELLVLQRGTSGWEVVAASYNSDLALPE